MTSEPRIPPRDSPQAYKMVQDLVVAGMDACRLGGHAVSDVPYGQALFISGHGTGLPGLGRMATPDEWLFAKRLVVAEFYRVYLERIAEMEAA